MIPGVASGFRGCAANLCEPDFNFEYFIVKMKEKAPQMQN